MRGRLAIGACVGLALLAGGCDPLERMYLREGAGVNLYDSEALDVAALQDAYIAVMCRHAGLPAFVAGEAPACALPAMNSPDWMMIVQAGMNDIDRRCDGWLTWLDNKSRWTGPIHQQIINTQIATQAILGYTLADPVTAINIVGAAFGFASNSFTAFNNRLLFQLEKSTVQGLVLQRQQDFRNGLPRIINNRPAAIYALRQYLRLCMPITIETQVNTTVKVFENTGPEGLRQSRSMIDPTAVNSAVRAGTIVSVRETPIVRFTPPPGVDRNKLFFTQVQDSLCVADRTGALNPATELAIRDYLVGIREIGTSAPAPTSITTRIRVLLDRARDAVPSCQQLGFMSAFEVGRYGIGTVAERQAAVRSLQDGLRSALSIPQPDLPSSGELDLKTRQAITRFRMEKSLRPALGGRVDAELLARVRD